MKVSAVIAYKSDPYIYFTINNLLKGINKDDIEIIVVDDGSDEPLECNFDLYPNVKIIRNQVSRGVGYAFDLGVKNCTSDNIVLLGADVIVKNPTWIDNVVDYCQTHKAGIGCSVCLSGDPTHLEPSNPADATKRYGAKILPFVTQEDLRSDSRLMEVEEYYVGAFDAQWIKKEPIEDVAEIPSVYGAFYFTTKSWYEHIGGWDTTQGMKISGHLNWGGLEPWLSLKNWLCGGKCHVVKSIETLHVFHKYDPTVRDGYVPSGKWEHLWYNKAFIAYSMLPRADAERLIAKIYKLKVQFELHTRQFNIGIHMLKKNEEYLNKIRLRNMNNFTRNFDWFCKRFNITKNF